MSIGIPFAFTTLNGALVCPCCALEIPESYDVVGERTSNNYAEHYAQKHAGVAGSSSDRLMPSARDIRAKLGAAILYDRYTVSLTVRVPSSSPLSGQGAAQIIMSALEVGLEGSGEILGPEDVELAFVDDHEESL